MNKINKLENKPKILKVRKVKRQVNFNKICKALTKLIKENKEANTITKI